MRSTFWAWDADGGWMEEAGTYPWMCAMHMVTSVFGRCCRSKRYVGSPLEGKSLLLTLYSLALLVQCFTVSEFSYTRIAKICSSIE